MALLSLSQKNRYDCSKSYNQHTSRVTVTYSRERACLRKLKLLQVEFLHDLVSDHVGRCEKPATATILLVRDRVRLELQFSVENVHVCDECIAANEGAIEIRMGKDRAGKSGLCGSRGCSLPVGKALQGQRPIC